MTSQDEPITQLLRDWQGGNDAAVARLLPLVYDELKRIASKHLAGERRHHTLQATALVNEAYLRLFNQNRATWQNRGQFLCIAARMMRRILVDYAREMNAGKRGADYQKVQLDINIDVPQSEDLDLEDLEHALKDLEAVDQTQCRIVEMRYFAGLSLPEVAEALNLPLARIKREWQMARAWLYQYLSEA